MADRGHLPAQGLLSSYYEGWQGKVYRWLGRRVELFARRVRYTHRRFDLRYHVLDPLADWLVWKAIRRGLRRGDRRRWEPEEPRAGGPRTASRSRRRQPVRLDEPLVADGEPWSSYLPWTNLTLDDARDKLSGWHFAKEALSEGEREILYVAEAVLRELDRRTESVS